MKTAIIYYSKHHGNTKQLLDALQAASTDEITLLNVLETSAADLEPYDLIGFASGIYYSKFQKKVLEFAQACTPNSKKVFFLYAYGVEKPNYTKAIRDALAGKNAEILGEYGCLGFNTFGPFKLIGGIAKGRPNEEDLADAVKFFEGISG